MNTVMVFNYIAVPDRLPFRAPHEPRALLRLTVGATDSDSWDNDLFASLEGCKGEILVTASLTVLEPGDIITQTMEVLVERSNPLHRKASAALPRLLDIAWEVLEDELNEHETKQRYMGMDVSS